MLRPFALEDKPGHLLSCVYERISHMASELIAGLGIFKSMFDIAKGLKDINDTTIRNATAVELQEKILSAREQQAAALERISQLEKELARFENWERDKQRYELAEIASGVFAYRLKPAMAGGEPAHCICAYCYGEAQKNPLQEETRHGVKFLRCHPCGSELVENGFKVGVYGGHYATAFPLFFASRR
jgi:hypothetical protein